ncbi:MAG: type II toxin-antitoxin system RelE/ParE family toxin [bacterium]|nr:type II toxin-antitoxin system RelE/ParE family toxin [bacterium]
MKIAHTPAFRRQFQSLDTILQSEVVEKLALFRNTVNHRQLKVHKLHGKLKGRFSFSVNYRYRIVFAYISQNEVVLHAVGDHEVYK